MYEVSRDDPDPDLFYSMSPNCGLSGVVSKLTVRWVDVFDITGERR